MKTDLLDPRAQITDLSKVSTEELREALAHTLDISALHILRMALIWQELERRGVDLSDLRKGLFNYLPAIAAGKLDAGLVVRLAGKPSLLARIGTLSIEDQRKLAQNGSVQIAQKAANGTIAHEDVPIERLSASQVNRLFIAGRIIPPDEQVAMPSKAQKMAPKIQWLEGGIIKIGHTKVRFGEVLSALPETEITLDTSGSTPIILKLTSNQHTLLKARAALAGLGLQEYVARVLFATGNFDPI